MKKYIFRTEKVLAKIKNKLFARKGQKGKDYEKNAQINSRSCRCYEPSHGNGSSSNPRKCGDDQNLVFESWLLEC